MEENVLLLKLERLQKENERLRLYAEMLSSLIANDVDCDVLPRSNSSKNEDVSLPRGNSSENKDVLLHTFDVNEENAKLLYNEVYLYLVEKCGSGKANEVRDGLKGRFETLLNIKL